MILELLQRREGRGSLAVHDNVTQVPGLSGLDFDFGRNSQLLRLHLLNSSRALYSTVKRSRSAADFKQAELVNPGGGYRYRACLKTKYEELKRLKNKTSGLLNECSRESPSEYL
ncbi:hypothetical protein TEQG_01843 [Trichophyton equinum CBS 127.97]|uniref:Uncharacterized protein n=1 Tax=Trichophyton equinum (strain ATCC MYA-4606 / CBS 127.97) TaxID=559882 RepID=F2PLN8_TRIEC|nr:hypothetical protein TEQG_01843 [Trichophyton equinum CBS 127.97]